MSGWKATLATALLAGSASARIMPQLDSAQSPLVLADEAPRPAHVEASWGSGNKTKPLVDSEVLQAGIFGPRLLGHAKTLFGLSMRSMTEYNHPTRVIGSGGHNGTLDYIYSIVSSLGSSKAGEDGYYHVWNQSFPVANSVIYGSRLVLNDTVPASADAMGMTPPTPDKEPVFGPLSLAVGEGCKASDYPAAVNGSIVLIRRGICSFSDKSDLAGKAGAIAAVIYNNEDSPLGGTLGVPTDDHVPTFSLSGAEAAPFVAALGKGDALDGIAFIDSEVNIVITTNILAQTVEGDPDNCVMLGGHSDSVTAGPGINDDGSGSLSLLEIATQLVRFRVNNCVRFAWWAAEEEGLLGSDYYAEHLTPEENQKIRLFMDYDMLGSPNFAYQIYNATDAVNPAGSEALRDLYVDWYTAHDLNYTFIPFDGRSDYDGFIRAGIPAGGIATGAEGIKTEEEVAMFGGTAGAWYDPCYHQLCDDVDNVNLTAWELNTKLVAHSVATYALSFEGFPNRTLESTAAAASTYGNTVKYHGGKLIR